MVAEDTCEISVLYFQFFYEAKITLKKAQYKNKSEDLFDFKVKYYFLFIEEVS